MSRVALCFAKIQGVFWSKAISWNQDEEFLWYIYLDYFTLMLPSSVSGIIVTMDIIIY